jgi:RNA polymerase sigma factor (sigma-70 family)
MMPILQANTDGALLAKYARSRDAEAFAELIRRHANLVFATARRITHNHDDAHDVSQECFLELARRAAQIDAPLPAWLHRVASTRALNLIRDAATRRRYESGASEVSNQPDEPDWRETEAIVDELLETKETLQGLMPLSIASAIVPGRRKWVG